MNSPSPSRQFPLSPPRMRCDSMMFRFPARLWRIVNSCRSGAISWGPSGKTLRITRSRFEGDYLKADIKPFKTEHFSSFIRQLNLYGFKKVTAPIILGGENIEDYDDLYEYRHPLFRQGKSELLPYLHRNCKSKKNIEQQIPKYIHRSTECQDKRASSKVLSEISQNVCSSNLQPTQRFQSVLYVSSSSFRKREAVEYKDIEKPIKSKKVFQSPDLDNHPLLRPVTKDSPKLQVNPLYQRASGHLKTLNPMFVPITRPAFTFHTSSSPVPKCVNYERSKHSVSGSSSSILFTKNVTSIPFPGRLRETNDETIISNTRLERGGVNMRSYSRKQNLKTSDTPDNCFNTSLNLDSFLVEHANQPSGLTDTAYLEDIGELQEQEDGMSQVEEDNSIVKVEKTHDKNDLYYLNKSIERHANLEDNETCSTIISNEDAVSIAADNRKKYDDVSIATNHIEFPDIINEENQSKCSLGRNINPSSNNIESNERFISIDISALFTGNGSVDNCPLIQLDSAIVELVRQSEQTKTSLDSLPVSPVENLANGILGYVFLPPK